MTTSEMIHGNLVKFFQSHAGAGSQPSDEGKAILSAVADALARVIEEINKGVNEASRQAKEAHDEARRIRNDMRRV